MRGYVVKKGRRYYAVIYEGIDPTTGRESRRWQAAGTRKTDAEQLVTELVKRHNDGENTAADRIALGEYLTERWLPVQQTRLRASTFHSYRRMIELHVIPTLGNVPLGKLVAADLDALYARLLVSGRRTGGPAGLSPSSVRYVHRILRKALGDAHRKGTVARNVATLADPPGRQHTRSSDGPPEMSVWTASQLEHFLRSTTSERLHSAMFLAAMTGMRRGEVLGLRWADVDLDGAVLSVRQSIVAVNHEIHVNPVKTGTSRRTIDLDVRTIEVLRAWRKSLNAEQDLVGRGFVDGDLVFPRPDGSATHPERLSRTFDRLVRAREVPRIRFHDLRHTHASLLLQRNVPVKVVSERLGHASPAFTMTVYQHVMPGMQAEAAATFADAIFGEDADDE